MKLRSNILKLSLFATGLSGIVAEYILATLGTYFLGDSVFQWTLIISVMLFSMGLGSRLSRFLETDLLKKFIFIEFTLSLLTAFSSLLVYTVAAQTVYSGLIIYSLSIIIGLLIGMEIPLVVRLNDEFESLKVNISSVLENDYYGSLLGGLFFAFVGLPYLGLTYTPIVLGTVNFSVALILLLMLWTFLRPGLRWQLGSFGLVTAILLGTGFFFAEPIIIFGEQKRYKDKVIFSKQSRYQKIVLTQWKDNYWLFINGNQQLSTIDEVLYHEPMVHPAMALTPSPTHVLILGGGDGCVAREVLKYASVKNIKVVDLDPEMTKLGQTHQVFLDMNQNALVDPRVTVLNRDGYTFLEQDTGYYDVIIVDLPDPKTVELGRLYSHEFYQFCSRRLRTHGFIVTQAGSPYYATRAFRCIELTMASAGFTTVPLHNQVLSLGEWGWIIGTRGLESEVLLSSLKGLTFSRVETEWLNQEAMDLITSFGKNFYDFRKEEIRINRIHDPVLYKYYLKGNWDLY